MEDAGVGIQEVTNPSEFHLPAQRKLAICITLLKIDLK